MLTAVLLAPLAVLLGQMLARDSLAIVPTATVVGVLAAVVKFLGLARWPFLVAELARAYADPVRDRGMPRLSPHRRVDDARRRGDAPVLSIRAMARLAGDPHRRVARRRLSSYDPDAHRRWRPRRT